MNKFPFLLEDKVVQLQCCNQPAGRYQHWLHCHWIQHTQQFLHSSAWLLTFLLLHLLNNQWKETPATAHYRHSLNVAECSLFRGEVLPKCWNKTKCSWNLRRSNVFLQAKVNMRLFSLNWWFIPDLTYQNWPEHFVQCYLYIRSTNGNFHLPSLNLWKDAVYDTVQNWYYLSPKLVSAVGFLH